MRGGSLILAIMAKLWVFRLAIANLIGL
jgi:hypothetical protein